MRLGTARGQRPVALVAGEGVNSAGQSRQAIRQATALDILQFDPAFECFDAHFKTAPPLKILVPPLGLVIAITSPQASR